MASKSTLVLLLSFVYFFFGTWLYNEYAPPCQPKPEIKIPDIPAEPIMFNWSSPTAVVNSTFDDFKKGILAGMTEDNVFEITGKYFKKEPTPDNDTDLGIARAEEIRKLFPEIANERIRLKSAIAEDIDGMENHAFPSANVQWINAPKELAPVVEIGNQTLIYFSANSAVGKMNPEVEEYLSKLAEILKSSDETVLITGHTDNTGEPQVNYQLGLARAKAMQDILLKLGVAPGKIKVDSKGENEPASTNDTEAGRASNRRTVIQRIK